MIKTFWRHKVSPMGLTGAILALIGVLFLVGAALVAGYTLLSALGMVQTRGTIVSCMNARGSCRPTVSFQTAAGQQMTFTSRVSSSSFVPEDAVTVWYRPENPRDAQIDPWIVTAPLAWSFAGTGLLLLLAGLLLYVFARNHPSAELVNTYYTAVEKQDYATAFQYLNPAMHIRTPQGEPITPAWFSERAQDYDATNGRVVDHLITNFALQPGRARFTVKLTRSKSTYKVHLNLLKQGDGWKITGFDLF